MEEVISFMQLDLSGKTALVTGATGQLGRVMARTLAACGANLALHYINNEKKAEELKDEIETLGRQAVIVQGDITKQDTADRKSTVLPPRWSCRLFWVVAGQAVANRVATARARRRPSARHSAAS